MSGQGMYDVMQLCDTVRETSFAIHRYLWHGHLEKVYENALAHRLRRIGLDVKQQYPLAVFDEDGTAIGDYFADLFIENQLIVELKATKALAAEHVAQLLGYLRAARMEHGLLINFGAPKFEIRSVRRSSRYVRCAEVRDTQIRAKPLKKRVRISTVLPVPCVFW
jgi:GxxExxY protein